jgi:hypothetical protein
MDAMTGASGYVPPANSPAEFSVEAIRSSIRQNSQDFKALKSALSTNNLEAATTAFTSLQQDIQSASQSAGGKSPFSPNSPIGQDFQALGSALQSGNLAQAQQAFAQFRQDIRSAGHQARLQSHQAPTGTSLTANGGSNVGGSSVINLLDATA